jgi:large subunit ribosomal protein L25
METLQATSRTLLGHAARRLRKEGFLPAVLYGQSLPTLSITVPTVAFQGLWRRAGESTLFTLETEEAGKKKAETVIIHDVALDPLYDAPIHADFYRVNMAEALRMFIPLEFVGEAPAVKEQEGVLIKQVHELEIEALPGDLPKAIIVDISSLRTFDDLIILGRLALPPRVKALAEADMVIAAVQPPRSAEELAELETPAAPSVADIELSEKRGKDEEEGEEKAPDETETAEK